MAHPQENIVWARMSVGSSALLISEWEKKINKEKEKENPSLDEIKDIEKMIEGEKLWLQDMQSILDGKKLSGKGIAIHRKSAQQQIINFPEDHPVYCNLKNVLRIYDRLEEGEPIGSYSCK